MSKATTSWLLLLIAAGGWLLYTLFSTSGITESNNLMVVNSATIPPSAIPIAESEALGDLNCTTLVPVRGGTLVEGIVGAPVNINPLLYGNNPVDRHLADLIFDGLVRFDERGEAQPALAESWTVSEDGLLLTFKLGAANRWHDGQPVRAQDVAYTYGLLQSAEIKHPDAILWQTVSIEIVDDLTIIFSLSEPYAAFMVALSRGLLPSHLLNGLTLDDLETHSFNSRPVGTGPFIVINKYWEEGALRLQPNQDYFAALPGIDWLEIRFFANEAERADSFLKGDIDALIGIDYSAIPSLFTLNRARFFTSDQLRYTQLMFNLSASGSTAIKQAPVRRALSLAGDQQEIVDSAVNGQAIPFAGPYAPSSWAATSNFSLTQADPVSATATLEEAGWTVPVDGELRIRIQNEVVETLSFRILSDDSAEHAAIVQSLLIQWQPLQADIIWTPLAWDAYYDALINREFDAALVRIDPLADPDLYDFWSQEAIVNGHNFAGWNNRRASEALEAGRQQYSIEERLPLYAAFNREFAADIPAISLYQYTQSYLISEQVVSAIDNRPIHLPRLVHPRDRFEGLDEWRINSAEIEITCES